MKKIIILLAFLVLGIILFAVAIEKIGVENLLAILLALAWWKILAIVGMTLLVILVSVLRWRVIIRGLGIEIGWKKVISAWIVGATFSYLTPVVFFGGEPLRAYFLKNNSEIPWSKNVASIVSDKALELMTNLVIMILGVSFLFSQVHLPFKIKLITILIITGLLGMGCFFLYKIFKKKKERGFFSSILKTLGVDGFKKIKKINGGIRETEEEISYFFKNCKKALLASIALSLVKGGLMITRYWVIILCLGGIVGFKETLAIVGTTFLIYFLPIPGALGIHEVSQAFIFELFGLGVSLGIASSVTLRCTELLMALVGIIMLVVFGWGILRSKLAKTTNKISSKVKSYIQT